MECDFDEACVMCESCSRRLCAYCNAQKHFVMKSQIRKFILKSHRFYLVCEECEENPRTCICLDCEEKMCDDCFKKIHKKGKR